MSSQVSKAVPEGKSLRNPLPKDYPWKVLGWMAEDLSQFISQHELETLKEIIRLRDFEGYLGLAESWGLQSIPADGVSCWLNYAARYQLAALLKNYRFATDRKTRVSKAIEKLLAGEAACADFNREGFRRLSGASEEWMANVFTYARSFLEKLLGWELPPFEMLTDRSRHGPGATMDTKCGLISSYFKFRKWPYQCTTAARRFARKYIYEDKRWLGALEDDYRRVHGIPMHAILDREVFWDKVLVPVDGNRISFVPKNARVERSIAIEPTMNLLLQLGVDGFIRRRLKRWGVDLDHQERNQRLAYLGSVATDDPFVTVDLANASNSVSLKVCELLLPREWYTYLCQLRSPSGLLDKEVISYEMISSMGNGYTFALESALFTAIIYAVDREINGFANPEDWAIFGDDLICRKSIFPRVAEALANCGFAINAEKTFTEGPVRESCGTDWLQGKLVRPVFLEDTPQEVDELFCDINRLKRILNVRWGIEESRTFTGLIRWVPEKFRDLVGPYSDEDFDSYIHSALPLVPYRNGVYKYKRLVRKPTGVKANNLHFRKLMHDLRPAVEKSKWQKCPYTFRKLTGFGGRFGVYRRGAFTLSTSYSVSEIWRREYTEYRPVGS